ncbi:ankyrin repeat domain-containing protein [Wolbachia endosymbiont (group A) of Longitarsus flavicornis]|uniref:ankyrin repeat domain-containing protein n=1 Tax=Wolbachia endosymbiont (group A) of Longitarsus flavicornis TaxID=3066134 RepID=UPI0030CA3797
MHGEVPNKELNEELRNILDQLESNRGLLDNPGNIKYIISLLEKGANRSTQNNGKTLSDYLDEKLSSILNELESNRGLLDNPNDIQRIMSLLQAGADPNIRNQNGKTLSDYLNEKLFDILNELESNRGLLNDFNYTQYIMFLLETGANSNIRNQNEETLSDYLNEKLFDILNGLESDRSLLDHHNYIIFFLRAGADPNIQNQNEKTLLHYVAERNDTENIRYLLEVIKANPSIRDESGKTPFEYITEYECRQAIEKILFGNSNSEKAPCDNNQTISTESSNCNTEDEDSSCSSSDYLFLEDSLLAKLEVPLTTDEQELIKEFCKDIQKIIARNKQEPEESIEKIVNKYLTEGIRLNSSYSNDNKKGDKETVTNLILEKINNILTDRVKPRDETREYIGRVNDIPEQDDKNKDKDKALNIIESITSKLLLKGGKARQKFLSGNTKLAQNYRSNYINNLSKKCKETESKLISIAYEGIVNRDGQAQKEKLETVEIDNQYFYMKYSQDSIIEPVKILNNKKAKVLNLKVGILQIGESIVRVESIDGKRNYTDILKGSIEMSFTTEVGEISIYLSPSTEGDNKIEVKIGEKSEVKLNELKAKKKSLGENCLLGGKSVLEAIEDKGFKKNGSVPTESIETTKDVPSTDLMQTCPQQIGASVKSR